jgi:small-conductance mechanosensitive channel
MIVRSCFPSSLLVCLLCAIVALCSGLAVAAEPTAASSPDPGIEAPLIVGHRTLHVFRATLGEFSPEERAAAAEQRVVQALDAAGEGWTSVKPTPHGFLVLIDDKPMFTVVRGDAREALGETPEDLANAASRRLQTAWREAQEKSDPRAILRAATKVTLAAIALVACLFVIVRFARTLRKWISNDWGKRIESLHAGRIGEKAAGLLPLVASRATIVAAWLTSLFVVFVFLTYGLGQFVTTRPLSEQLAGSLLRLMNGMLGAAGAAIPGLFVSVVIFLLAWIATQVSTQLFQHVETSKMRLGMLDHHTAPATRRIANASIWLFAAAMAYPYLPGSHTEAFKGLTVIMGLMVSIGASGLVGQIASGVILVYTRAVGLGEYVKVQECQGTVTELGLFVTRLRTGMGEEIALPNALVLGSVIHNFSRASKGRGFVLDATVTIGYDTPWRQVHAMLLAAAGHIPSILRDPAPYVMQTALCDFYVEYRLVVYADSDQPAARARIASDLNANIQDEFNRHGVQIMSPHYRFDPQQPKVVPEAQWYAAPAVVPPSDTPSK